MTTSHRPADALDVASVARGLVNQLAASAAATEDEWRVRRAAWELLSRGPAVPEDDVVAASGAPHDVVGEVLSRDVERDEQGRLVGVSGLTLVPTQHRIRLGYEDLYTWCALDLLFFPRLLDTAAEFESRCPTTGGRISGRIAPDGSGQLEPEEAVLSLLVPRTDEPVRSSFCTFVNFFRSAQVAEAWVGANPGAHLLDVTEALELAEQLARSLDPNKEE